MFSPQQHLTMITTDLHDSFNQHQDAATRSIITAQQNNAAAAVISLRMKQAQQDLLQILNY